MDSINDGAPSAQAVSSFDSGDTRDGSPMYAWLGEPGATLTFDELLTLLGRPADSAEKRLLPVHSMASAVAPQKACLVCDPAHAAGDASSIICGNHPSWVVEQLAARGGQPALERVS